MQLAASTGACLVVHLAHVPRRKNWHRGAPDGHHLEGMKELAQLLQDRNVIKAGVGIELDAVDLYREHRLILSARFDLGGIGARCSRLPNGLAALSRLVVPGLELAKSRTITMSNWAQLPLSSSQISYAAADAFAAAAVVSTMLTSASATKVPFIADLSRLREVILSRERRIEEIEARATRRKAAKIEIKARETVVWNRKKKKNFDPMVVSDPLVCEMWEESPLVFKAKLEEARRVFAETRPDSILSSDDFIALDMM